MLYIFKTASGKAFPPGLILNSRVTGINSFTFTTTLLSQSSVLGAVLVFPVEPIHHLNQMLVKASILIEN